MSSSHLPPPRQRTKTVPPSHSAVSREKAGEHPVQAAGERRDDGCSGTIKIYLTRAEVAERYPISCHTLAKLASQRRGPRFYKPTDKALYRPEDIEAWIEASAIVPVAVPAEPFIALHQPEPKLRSGRGRASPPSSMVNATAPTRNGRKSLPPSANSWLRRET